MQYDERKKKPESNWTFLVKQVQEQSYVCDVTVKQGFWEKKFHRCVLVASPFFDNVLKNNYLEKQTGIIEMTLGSPTTLEMAIMFLYGKQPNLTQDNIEHLLYLAEFLLIPNLKSACISWLRTLDITVDNCMHVLQLSSIFDFYSPAYAEFIEGHLSELLLRPEMVSLTVDSINVLFSDPKLSYVSMDEKLKFLLKWKDRRHDQNTDKSFKELLATIDFNDVSVSYLQEIQDNQRLNGNLDVGQILRNRNDKQRVLVMKADREDGTFWCFDLERKTWYRLDSRVLKEERPYSYKTITGMSNLDSEIHFKFSMNQQQQILVVNIDSDSCRHIKLVYKDSGENFKMCDDLQMLGKLCVVNVNELQQTKREPGKNAQLSGLSRQLQQMSLMECSPSDRLLRMTGNREANFTDTSTIYTGNIADEVVEMSPLLSFKDDKITKLCIGKNLTIALLFESNNYISLYDLVDNTIERQDIYTNRDDKLSPTEEGFVVYNNKRCLCLTRLTGLSLSTKYVVKEISFKCDQIHAQSNKLFLRGETWYHYYRKNFKETFKWASAPYRIVSSRPTTENVEWKPLPLPIEYSSCHADTIKDNCFEICLPKSKLRCNTKCPHCKVFTRPQPSTATYHHDSDDYFYEDTPDDDYYGYGYDDYGYYVDYSD